MDNLDQEFNLVPKSELAYCQIHNPPNLKVSELAAMNPRYGLFIPAEQAEKVSFHPNEWFEEMTLTFGDEGDLRHVPGYLARHLRLCLVAQSEIEVQERTANGWRYIGNAYQQGTLSEFGALANQFNDSYRLRNRLLIVMLDAGNKPLHSAPLLLGLGRGTGAALMGEYRALIREMNAKICERLGQSDVEVSREDQCRFIFDLDLGYHKSSGRAPFVCPGRRLSPTNEAKKVGSEVTVSRAERQVVLVAAKLESLFVSKSSELGQKLSEWHCAHKDFARQHRDTLIEPPSPSSEWEEEEIQAPGAESLPPRSQAKSLAGPGKPALSEAAARPSETNSGEPPKSMPSASVVPLRPKEKNSPASHPAAKGAAPSTSALAVAEIDQEEDIAF